MLAILPRAAAAAAADLRNSIIIIIIIVSLLKVDTGQTQFKNRLKQKTNTVNN